MKTKVIAELICSAVGEGTSVSRFVKEAVKVIDNFDGIRVLHHPMGTVIEADNIDTVFQVTKMAHEAIFQEGVQRVVTQIRIDDRRDKPRKMEDKVSAITD